MVCARRPRRGKRSAAAVSSDLASAARSSSEEEIEDFLGLEAGAFDAQLVDGRFDVGQAAEIDADGGAARGGLRARGRAQVFDGLAGFRQVFGQARAIGVRRDFFQLAAAERAGDVAAQQLAEGFEFENVGAGFQGAIYILGVCGRPFQSPPGCLR